MIQRLAELAPKLRPELLHRVIGAYGLEDCVDLVAQATPAQLSQIFDLDLWRPSAPGLDEQFDAARFGVWLEVLVEAGPEVAAAKIAAMPLPQIIAGLAHHVRVYDISAVSEYETTGGERWDYSRPIKDLIGCEIGGFHVAATRENSWDAIVAVLVALDIDHQDRFLELMRGVRSRSHSLREADGFHALLQNRDQMMFDAADERERRRRERGFASPAEARAFLQMSRSATADTIAPNPIARDYARSIEYAVDEEEAPIASPEEEIEIAELLTDAGVAPMQPPRGLLVSGDIENATAIQRCMRVVSERDPVAFSERNVELAYLANVLIPGCSLRSRPFTPKEAADGAVAICNLGLETLDDIPADYLIAHDLIGMFQLGWGTLHRDVCMFAARSLTNLLSTRLVSDDDVQRGLNVLRMRLLKEIDVATPWRAASALEVLAEIDLPAWAAMTGLIAECPVMHAGLIASLDRTALKVDPDAFEFISSRAAIAQVYRFLQALEDILRG